MTMDLDLDDRGSNSFSAEVEEQEEFWHELGRALQGCPALLPPRSASPEEEEDYWPSSATASCTSSSSSEDEEEDDEIDNLSPSRRKRVRHAPPSPPPLLDPRKTSSSYRGVSLCAKDCRWQARIRIRKEVVYLGRFETEELAARRYDEAAREHHGDKALINFITPADRAEGRKSVFEQAGGKSVRVV